MRKSSDTWGGIGVGIFFIITGFFTIFSEHPHLKKVVGELCYYGWFTLIVFIVIRLIGVGDAFGSDDVRSLIINAFSPAANGIWWFATAYVLVIMMSPMLNSILKCLNRKGRIFVLILSWFVLMVVGAVSGSAYNNLYRGMFFYIIGGIFRINTLETKEKPNNSRSVLILSVVLAIAGWMLSAGLEFYITEYKIMTGILTLISSSIIVPICAVFTFKLFLILPIRQSKLINDVAATTFGIYLIHDSFISRIVIWEETFHIGKVVYQSWLFPLFAIVISIIVFVICSVIDEFRIRFIEPLIMRLSDFFKSNLTRKDKI